MLYKTTEGKYALMPLIATYSQNAEVYSQHVESEDELLLFQELGHITNVSFEPAEYSADMVARLVEVESYPENEYQAVNSYVMENTIIPGSAIETKIQQETLEQSILDLTLLVLGGGL